MGLRVARRGYLLVLRGLCCGDIRGPCNVMHLEKNLILCCLRELLKTEDEGYRVFRAYYEIGLVPCSLTQWLDSEDENCVMVWGE